MDDDQFMLVAKSGYIRNMVMESTEADLSRMDLSDIPGGPEIFEKAAKFCYGVNFEINVHNVAALRCAAEYLEMTDRYCEANLGSRTDDFLSRVALLSFSGALVVLKCCEHLLPLAEDLNIVQRCVDVVSAKACSEANFPSRSPTNWWTEELSILDVQSFAKIISSIKSRGAKTHTLCSALITFTERALRDLVRDHSGGGVGVGVGVGVLHNKDDDEESRQKSILESIVRLMPAEKAAFSVNFLCCLLRSAIFLKTATDCKKELEKRIAAILEHVTVDDLLVLSFTYDGERLFDLESVRRIISTFVEKEKEKSAAVFNEVGSSSSAMQRVAKTVDTYLGEIASYEDLSIAKFNGIAVLVPKAARNVDDDLYRAIDIYLKAHPGLDEIEREKVCSVMDALKLSYEARVHASQNKRLPVQIVLHALYYDQLKLRSVERTTPAHDHPAPPTKLNQQQQLQTDLTLVRENEALRSELIKMKMYISHMQTTTTTTTTTTKNNNNNSNHIINDHQGSSNRGGGGGGPAANRSSRPSTFFSSVSKTLGRLNPFRHGSKDTSNIDDGAVDLITKPRRRRFSIS